MFHFTSDDFFIKKISHVCMGEEDDSPTGGGSSAAGSQSDAQASENDNRDNSTGNRDGGTGRQQALREANKASSQSAEISFEDNDSAMAALGAMQAASLQSDAQTFESLAVASNQAQVDVESLVGELNDTTQQLLAQSVETNVNMDTQPRELEGAAAFWARVGEFFTPATFTGIQNPNTLVGGIDVGLNIGDLVGLPGNSLFELATGKGILETVLGETNFSLSGGTSAKPGIGSEANKGTDRTNRVEGGGGENARKTAKDRSALRDGKKEKEPEENAIDQFNRLMDEALQQQLESKIFDMPEFQLLQQINSSNGGSS